MHVRDDVRHGQRHSLRSEIDRGDLKPHVVHVQFLMRVSIPTTGMQSLEYERKTFRQTERSSGQTGSRMRIGKRGVEEGQKAKTGPTLGATTTATVVTMIMSLSSALMPKVGVMP